MNEQRNEDEQVPTFSDSLSAALRDSGLGQLKPGEAPTAGAMLGALGGVRGLIESITPGFAFLVLYTLTQNLLLSVLVPVGVAVVFVVARLLAKSPIAPALAGAIGIALTAGLAIATNRPENNFLPGIVINAGVLVVLLVSLAARWPLVGVFIGALFGEGTEWRADRAKRRAYTLATWVWVIPSAVRLAVQVPLYFAGLAEILAGSKLITGIPLYLGALWVTWLLVRAVHTRPQAE